jgi:hypothetical protein
VPYSCRERGVLSADVPRVRSMLWTMDRISWPCGRSISRSSGVGSRKCIHWLTLPLSAGMVAEQTSPMRSGVVRAT